MSELKDHPAGAEQHSVCKRLLDKWFLAQFTITADVFSCGGSTRFFVRALDIGELWIEFT